MSGKDVDLRDTADMSTGELIRSTAEATRALARGFHDRPGDDMAAEAAKICTDAAGRLKSLLQS